MRCKTAIQKCDVKMLMQKHDAETWCKRVMQKHDAKMRCINVIWCKNMMQKCDAKTWWKNSIQKHEVKTWCKNVIKKGYVKTWCKNVIQNTAHAHVHMYWFVTWFLSIVFTFYISCYVHFTFIILTMSQYITT